MKLTRERAQDILGRGRVDDARLAALIAADATEEELLEAKSRTLRTGVGAIVRRPMSARVARLCSILSEAEEEGWGEDR